VSPRDHAAFKIVEELHQTLSLSFRLFGNILPTTWWWPFLAFLVFSLDVPLPWFLGLSPVPIQALIFATPLAAYYHR